MIDFQTSPERYKHWQVEYKDDVAYVKMNVSESHTLVPGYELKMNSYDLSVDIELYDVVQRMRFEHPEVGCVVITSGNEKIFCAGANIKMLGQSSHAHKVNFCKFTNETRNGIEDASQYSGQMYISALNGTAAGGGYELALATDYIMLIDDGNAAVSLPEVPLLAVLPGTGGLTRVVDKRKVRRDRADIFCSVEEGARGERATEWGLVDESIPRSEFWEKVQTRAEAFSKKTDRPNDGKGVALTPLKKVVSEDKVDYSTLSISLDKTKRIATVNIIAPETVQAVTAAELDSLDAEYWPLRFARELDDAILHLRTNEPELGIIIFKSQGNRDNVMAYDKQLLEHQSHWLIREITLYLKRTFKRVDVTSRTFLTLIEPGSCFCGFLAEFIFASDRSYMLSGTFSDDDNEEEAVIKLSEMNFGVLPMSNDMSRIETRLYGEPEHYQSLAPKVDQEIKADEAYESGLVTYAHDDIDWEDEIRLFLEERASYSPDALIGMEANLRFPGPETLETKIFARLSAWQNWIFQRPNAVGVNGALQLYGTGARPEFNFERV